MNRAPRRDARLLVMAAFLAVAMLAPGSARSSTYVVYIPLDSSIYEELDTLDGLGWLDTYIAEVKPIARVEAARLVVEADRNLKQSDQDDPLARRILRMLHEQLAEEIGWVRTNTEDLQPTMVAPINRLEGQYLFERGRRRRSRVPRAVSATENTPLLQNADGIPTAPGSNEIVRVSGWGGLGGFLTLYGEGALAGPLTRPVKGTSRVRQLDAEAVVSLGNAAISFGTEEMRWGTGQFGVLSRGANAPPFPALRIQSIHPSYLPWIFRYLGPGRKVLFMGQLDGRRSGGRNVADHPWIVGHIVAFKPLPWFELGLDRAIIFGGRNNDHYGFGGFLGRFTGLATGNPARGNTHSRAGVSLKFAVPQLRGTQIYQEMLGEDNLTREIPGIGRYLPFLAVSYQGGVYVPRLTADGLTDFRFEYSLLEPNYSIHGTSEDFTFNDQFQGDPLGPNATRVTAQIGRWFDLEYKVSLAAFYTERAPTFGSNSPFPASSSPNGRLAKERSVGATLDVLRLGTRWAGAADTLAAFHAQAGVEYGTNFNYDPGVNSLRILFMFSTSLRPQLGPWKWH